MQTVRSLGNVARAARAERLRAHPGLDREQDRLRLRSGNGHGFRHRRSRSRSAAMRLRTCAFITGVANPNKPPGMPCARMATSVPSGPPPAR